jgi:hypothetical protein
MILKAWVLEILFQLFLNNKRRKQRKKTRAMAPKESSKHFLNLMVNEYCLVSRMNSPGFCLATAANAIGGVGRIVDGDCMLLLLVLFAKIWAADGWILLGVINGLVLCEAAAEAVDVLMLLLLSEDAVAGNEEMLFSIFALTAVGCSGRSKLTKGMGEHTEWKVDNWEEEENKRGEKTI